MADIRNQLVKNTYNYVLQSDLSTGYVYRIGGDVPVNPIFSSGLTILDNFKYSNGTEQNGYVLYSDGIGNAYWGAPPSGSGGTVSGDYLPLSGGTVTGDTTFTSGLTVNYIDFDTIPNVPNPTGGTLFWDSNTNSLSYKPITNNNDVTINIGQENVIPIYNNLGYTILNGKALNITGSTNGLPTVTLSIASGGNNNNFQVDGIATHDIPNNQVGFMTHFGVVRDINLSPFTNGEDIYLSQTSPGDFDSYNNLSFTGRTIQVGHVNVSGVNGELQISIDNEPIIGLVTSREENILVGNNSSTGVFEFTGLTIDTPSGTTFSVAPVKGWIVDNTTNPTSPQVQYISYAGGSNIQSLYFSSDTETYILLTSGLTITQQTTFPTPQQRRQNIYLGKFGHGTRQFLINAFSEPDLDISPLSQFRDMFTPIRLINDGVLPSPNGVNLSFNTSAGYLWGLGINFRTSSLNPSRLTVNGNSPATFQYRTQTGGTATNVTVIDPTKYDVNGAITTIIGTKATNQRIYLLQNGQIRVQYGQTTYNQLSAAIAAVQTESFVTFPNFRDNAILIGILSILTTCTDLTDNTKAQLFFTSKFGETVGAAGGASTTTLQQAYNNSSEPEILINSTLDGLSIRNGTGNADNTTPLLQGQNTAGSTTSFIRADGLISGQTVSTPGVTLNNNGLTATTISATTYLNLPTDVRVTGSTYSNNNFTFTNNTGGTFSVLFNTVTGLTTNGNLNVTGSTSSGIISATTYQNLPTDVRVTGGTYSNGTTTFTNNTGGTFTVTGFSTPFTGGTVTGATFFSNGLSANTFSATTLFGNGSGLTGTLKYYISGSTPSGTINNGDKWFNSETGVELTYITDTDGSQWVQVNGGAGVSNAATGGTYSNGTITLLGTGTLSSITGLTTPFTGGTVTGSTYYSNGLSANTISATTYLNLPTDVRVTGATYSNNTFTFTNNTGGTYSVLFNTVTGLTINGNLNVTGTTSSGIISATTYQNLPSQSGTGVSLLSYTPTTGILTLTKNDTTTLTAGTFTYLTGTSYSNNVVTLTNNLGSNSTITINTVTGLTVNGNLVVTGTTTSTTISATTYQNLPTDIRVTGGTYSNGSATFTNNTGGTFNVSGFYTGATDVFVTGATYSNNTFTFTNNTGGTFNTLFNTVTGLTINGNLTVTGNTSLQGLTATTISATTYQNIPIKYYKEFSGAPSSSPIVLGTDSISIGNGAESRSTYMLSFGTNAGKNATGATVSTFIGNGAGYDASGSTYVVFIGPNAGYGAINALTSTFIGNGTGNFSTGITQSNFIGFSSGSYSKDLNNSNVFGYQAGQYVTNAQYVNYFGHQAGYAATNATLSNFFGFSAGLSATNAQNSNFIGTYAGSQSTGASFSTLIGYSAGKFFTGNHIGSNNIIIGTNLSLPNGTANGLNIGGVLFGTGFYSNTGTDPLIIPNNGKIGINVVSPSTALHVGGDLTVTGFTSSSSFTGTSDTISGSKGTVITNGSTGTAFIVFSGSNTAGGTGYTDFIRVVNTAVGATNTNKTIRVSNTGGFEIVNSAYNAQILAITDNGIMAVGGSNSATSTLNDATSNYLTFNNNNSQIYDDGNFHIHSRTAGQSMWINTNGAQLNLLTQSPTATGGIGSGIAIATGTLNGYVTINTGRTVTTASAYGYLTTGGAGTYPGGSQSVVISLYATNRIWGQEIDAFSDERMKNIQGEISLEDGIKLVNNLKPIKYTWKEGDDKGIKAGYSAQQVIKSGFDHLIGLIPTEGLEERIDEDGFVSPKDTQFAMNYDQVTPYHGVVIKHLLEEITSLKEELTNIKKGLNNAD